MRKPEFDVGQKVFSTIFTEVGEGLVDEIIYVTPGYDLVLYGISWSDGNYTREQEWKLSDTKVII